MLILTVLFIPIPVGGKGVNIITDPPVDGAIAALYVYIKHFHVAIYSARSGQQGGIEAMKDWFRKQDYAIADYLLWPSSKPAASVYLDDRGLRFGRRMAINRHNKKSKHPLAQGTLILQGGK